MNYKELDTQVLEFLTNSWDPMTADQIAQGVRLYEDSLTCPRIRASIRRLNLEGHPIVSTAHGFLYTLDPDQLYAYRERLWSRAEQIIVRAHAITNIVRKLENVKA